MTEAPLPVKLPPDKLDALVMVAGWLPLNVQLCGEEPVEQPDILSLVLPVKL